MSPVVIVIALLRAIELAIFILIVLAFYDAITGGYPV